MSNFYERLDLSNGGAGSVRGEIIENVSINYSSNSVRNSNFTAIVLFKLL